LRIQSAVWKKAAAQALAQIIGHTGLAHGLVHAGQPLVALQDADGKRHVAHLEAGMAELVGVVRRPPQPAAEKPEQLVARAGQV
jgi:hypothetical protein